MRRLATAASRCAARAQGKLDARYAVTLGRHPARQGRLAHRHRRGSIHRSRERLDDRPVADLRQRPGTAPRAATSPAATCCRRATPSTMTSDKKSEELRIALSARQRKEFASPCHRRDDPERIPVTDAHRHGVIDPMTASLIRVPGNGDLMTPEACGRATSVFDGRMRYDLEARLQAHPAGARPKRAMTGRPWSARSISRRSPATSRTAPAIKYLIAQRDMEMWLAPIAAPTCWCRSAPRCRRRSASACCRRRNSSRWRSRTRRRPTPGRSERSLRQSRRSPGCSHNIHRI